MGKLIAAIVDDNQLSAEITAEMCRLHDFEPIIYTSAIDAIFGLEQSRPNIVITDIHMPNMNGEALLRQLAEPPFDFEKVPIAVLTGDRKSASLPDEHDKLRVRIFIKGEGLKQLGLYLDTLKPSRLS